MNNSKWQIFKVGLVNFWYYDEEEFYFLDGRMVLRGANGSGKSVTMQSFIPLLLDGNMRPERLDPFGSRARKMENYLLEEEDDREERTGYLYMEFKRLDAEQFLTIGIGMRARKNKKLEPWYFYITDGRRIGKEFPLYKDIKSKIPFSKAELKNRIGEGGKVMDTQNEYISSVNRLLFGFETLEEYREMLELLIQLRTPKLSKDFKPSIINDILSNSLQTLSEDDLRPMSEAIENMDNIKTNLDSLTESIHAAEQMKKVYDGYNQVVLLDKAKGFLASEKEWKGRKEKEKELEALLETAREKQQEEETRYESLKREQEVLEKERASLSESDAAKLKEEEQRLLAAWELSSDQLQEKEKQEERKREDYIDWEQKRRQQEEKNETEWETLENTLEEMDQDMEDIPFDEHDFFKRELLEKKEEQYSFSAYETLLVRYQEKVEAGIKILEKEEQAHRVYDTALKELDEKKERRNQAERSVLEYEALLQETKEELLEKMYQWKKNSRMLAISDPVMTEISRKIDQYIYGNDYSEITELLRKEKITAEDKMREKRQAVLFEKKPWEEMLKNSEEELRHWEEKKEAEPERSAEVLENRKKLKEWKIEGIPFYKAVDFSENLSEEEAGNIEEALSRMGILDALLVPEIYREKVFSVDPGLCDRYIFADISEVKENIKKALTADSGQADSLVDTILSGIGYGEGKEEMTRIDREGNYKIGILEGNTSRKNRARFIGTAARERYRAEKIKEWKEKIEEIKQALEDLEKQREELDQKLELLNQEWLLMPKEEDVKIAAKELDQRERELQAVISDIRKKEEDLEGKRKDLEQVQLRAQEICAKAYLTIRLDVFKEAGQSLRQYEKKLSEVKINYERYFHGLSQVKSYEDYLERLDEDLDMIRHDIRQKKKENIKQEESLASVREQLKLTDYEAIRERLDHCIVRLKNIPEEIEAAVKLLADWENKENRLLQEQEENKEAVLRTEKIKKEMETVFLQEYALAYVPLETMPEESVPCAEKISVLLRKTAGEKKQEDFHDKVQEVFHQYKGYLTDYQLMMQTRFEDLREKYEDISARITRLDLKAKYRGAAVSFPELLIRLKEDAENLKRVLSEKDRELFEDILANTISKKIRARIHASRRWVENMNRLMESMNTSSGLKLSLKWKSRRAEKEDQLDTRALVELLQKDSEIMRREETEKMSRHFRSKIEEARKRSEEGGGVQSFHMIMREILDYRQWFEFQLECQKTGEKKKELTDRVFFTFSGGEKAMSMYVPLFSAVVAKYSGARSDAPRLISLDEAFAGVDETNIKDMFRLMVEFEFNFMINSQILWGDYETVPSLAIYQLVRPENAKFVTVIPYRWNGHMREMKKKAEDMVGTA